MKKFIHVNGIELACLVLADDAKSCLDLRTGQIVPLRKCSAKQVGEGREGAKKRKRFLLVPYLDEWCVAIGWQHGACNHRGQLVEGPALKKVAAIAARRWLASLRLPVGVVWEQGFRRQYLDVERHAWTDIT